MTEIRDLFSELDGLDVMALHVRREAVIARANGNYETLDDDSLAELLQISRCLRKKAAAPGGAPRGKKKTASTLEDLA